MSNDTPTQDQKTKTYQIGEALKAAKYDRLDCCNIRWLSLQEVNAAGHSWPDIRAALEAERQEANKAGMTELELCLQNDMILVSQAIEAADRRAYGETLVAHGLSPRY